MSVRFQHHSRNFEREGTELVAEDEFSISSEVRMYPMQHGSSFKRSLFAWPRCTRRELCLFLMNTCLLAALVLAGFLVGYYTTTTSACGSDAIRDYDASLARQLLELVNVQRIRDTVQKVSSKAHVTGTPSNTEVYRWIYDQVMKLGKFSTRVFTYDVYLDQPNVVRDAKGVQTANTVELLDGDGKVVSSCVDCAPQSDNYVPFTAFSATGEFVGKPVYINYGRVADFERLKNASIDCSGKVLIARLGEVTRGVMAWRAFDYCRQSPTGQINLALLVYPDPNVYPNAQPSETSSGVNRYMNAFGDLLTPSLPSVQNVHREDEKFLRDKLPNVLVQPISWHFATILMRNMSGPVFADSDWKGKMSEVAYAAGPGYAGAQGNYKVRVSVSNKANKNSPINNIITVIPGAVERDRYVIVGAHYDTLTCGARDNAGSVAVLLEMMRLLHDQYQQNWKPQRTIVFAFWDAEELGQIGSTEFVEEFGLELQDRAIAYINLDGVVSGTNRFVSNEHPLFYQLLANVTGDIDWPTTPGMSIAHRWLVDLALDFTENYVKPGSIFSQLTDQQQRIAANMIDEQVDDADVVSWWTERGVPFISPRFVDFPAGFRPGSGGQQSIRAAAAVPHSGADTFNSQVDTDSMFIFHRSITHIVMLLTMHLSDSVILPANPIPFAVYASIRFSKLVKAKSSTIDQVQRVSPSLNILKRITAVQDGFAQLLSASKAYAQRADTLKRTTANAFALRRMNERLMLVDHAFDTTYNYKFRETKSSLFAADRAYEQHTVDFPGVRRALDALATPSLNDFNVHVNLARELSILLVGTQRATRLLYEQNSFLTD